MPRTHAAYSPEFRQRMVVELVRAGRTPEELAKKFEPSANAIRNWVTQADRDEGRRQDGFTTAEREEVRRLRRENRAPGGIMILSPKPSTEPGQVQTSIRAPAAPIRATLPSSTTRCTSAPVGGTARAESYGSSSTAQREPRQ
jgi:transposase